MTRFLLVTFNLEGSLEAISCFQALAHDSLKSGKARAFIMGAAKYHVYRIVESASGVVEFKRIQ